MSRRHADNQPHTPSPDHLDRPHPELVRPIRTQTASSRRRVAQGGRACDLDNPATSATRSASAILVLVDTRLAQAEEREVAARFGSAWRDYATRAPAFIPHRRPTPPTDPAGHARPATGTTRRAK